MTENSEPSIPPARVQKAAGHYLVTHATWQISVAPDGLLMLPRHLHPEEVEDFVRCALVAKDIGAGVIKENDQKTPAPAAGLNGRGAIIQHGPPPPGTTRMRVTSAQQRAASMGREKRREGERAIPARATQRIQGT